VTNEPSTRRRWPHLRHPGRWLLVLTLAACAWLGWRAYDERAAIREAQEAGWQWGSRDPVSLILADWRAAGKKETWTVRYREVFLPRWTDLASARPLLDRLRPTKLHAMQRPDLNLDALRGLSGLQVLEFTGSPGLQNVDGLRGLHSLQRLHLGGCIALQNVDGLRGLPALQIVELPVCTSLRDVDGLRGLPTLRYLQLGGCSGLLNVNALRGLPALESLGLRDCTALPAPALRELRTALPATDITFPDGTNAPP